MLLAKFESHLLVCELGIWQSEDLTVYRNRKKKNTEYRHTRGG